jgi:hypothetical protein
MTGAVGLTLNTIREISLIRLDGAHAIADHTVLSTVIVVASLNASYFVPTAQSVPVAVQLGSGGVEPELAVVKHIVWASELAFIPSFCSACTSAADADFENAGFEGTTT